MSDGRVRRDAWLSGLVALLLFTLYLGGRDLWNPNEPLYGRAVVEMAESGDWLLPRVNGEVFAEKPILYFWLARGAASLTGSIDETSLRLPAALAGALLVVLTFLWVVPYGGRRRARLAAMLVGTIQVIFWSARQVQMDLLLTTCVLGAVIAATRVLDHGLDPRRGGLLAGVAVGLGCLAKGPVGAILPALVLLPLLLTGNGRRTAVLRAVPWALAAASLTVAPWIVMLWQRGRLEFLVEAVLRQNVTRVLAPWDHTAPWWYFLRYFWIDLAPWSLLVPLAWGLGRSAGERRLVRVAWIYIAMIVLFFSLPASKRSTYIMPVAPAVAVLAAAVVDRFRAGSLGRRRTWAVYGLTGGLGLLSLAGAWLGGWRVLPRYPQLAGAGWAAVVWLALSGITLLVTALSRRRRALFAGWLVFVAGLYVLAAVAVLPAVDAYKSPRAFSERVLLHVDDDAPLCSYWQWRWRAGYSFYTGRSIPWLGSPEALAEYWSRDETVYLLTDRGALDEVRRVIGTRPPLEEAEIGSNRAYLFSNRQPAGSQAR